MPKLINLSLLCFNEDVLFCVYIELYSIPYTIRYTLFVFPAVYIELCYTIYYTLHEDGY